MHTYLSIFTIFTRGFLASSIVVAVAVTKFRCLCRAAFMKCLLIQVTFWGFPIDIYLMHGGRFLYFSEHDISSSTYIVFFVYC